MRPLLLPLALLAAACGGRSDDPLESIRQARDPKVREAAIGAFLERGPAAADLWADLLDEADAEIPRLAAAALRRGADLPAWRAPPRTLLDPLLGAAARPEPGVRAEAVLAVGRLYAEDPGVPPRVEALLRDPDARVRRAAVEAFEDFGPSTAGMELPALRALVREEPALSLEAAEALAACGLAPPEAVERLALAVETRDDPARGQRAARALSRLGPLGAAAAPRAAAVLPGAPELLARDLADALGLSGSGAPAVVEALARALARREEAVRAAAALALVRLGRGEAAGVDAALQSLRASREPAAALRAAEGWLLLGRGGPEDWDRLVAAASEPAGSGAAAAVEALGRVAAAGWKPVDASTERLSAAADDPRLEVRRAASRATAALLAPR